VFNIERTACELIIIISDLIPEKRGRSVVSSYIPDVHKSELCLNTILIWIVRVIFFAVCVGALILVVVRDILPII
jgi:hypothetical protein